MSGRSAFEITHPFHPDRGRRLVALHSRVDGRDRWLWYADRAGVSRQVKESFTDRVPTDGFLQQAGRRCAFRLSDLVRLTEVMERLSRELEGRREK